MAIDRDQRVDSIYPRAQYTHRHEEHNWTHTLLQAEMLAHPPIRPANGGQDQQIDTTGQRAHPKGRSSSPFAWRLCEETVGRVVAVQISHVQSHTKAYTSRVQRSPETDQCTLDLVYLVRRIPVAALCQRAPSPAQVLFIRCHGDTCAQSLDQQPRTSSDCSSTRSCRPRFAPDSHIGLRPDEILQLGPKLNRQPTAY
jgi:hypothetical protein